jgi:hypothetical protein
MQMNGYYVEQIAGVPPLPFSKFRPKSLNTETGAVVPMTDRYGNVVMGISGPDIVNVPPDFLPTHDVREWLRSDPWVEFHSSANKASKQKAGSNKVQVVYVHMNEVAKKWKKIVPVEERGLISVPVGNPITKSNGGTDK